jgi:hypothetical protein
MAIHTFALSMVLYVPDVNYAKVNLTQSAFKATYTLMSER